MANFMRPYESQTYALFRIVAGFLFLWHGIQLLFGVPGTPPAGVPAFVTLVAGPIELIGGTLVMIGPAILSAAFLCSGLMAFAYWTAPSPQGLLPILNQGELAVP